MTVGGREAVIANLEGKTNGTPPPGAVFYRGVRDAEQDFVTVAPVPPPRWQAFRFADPGLVSIGRAASRSTPPARWPPWTATPRSARPSSCCSSPVPASVVMRPQYGSLLHRLVFAPDDATTAGLAIHYVRQALVRWEPRVEVLDVDAGPIPTPPSSWSSPCATGCEPARRRRP